MALLPSATQAQIGYQVSLLNTATGEPRAGVTVNATVTITDSADKTIYTGTQQATTNDFGVLSLTVGNSETFSKADFTKLPFFISVSVDGTLIGKSQILSVPVAEYAKKTGVLTKEMLVGTWKYKDYDWYSDEQKYDIWEIRYAFSKDGIVKISNTAGPEVFTYQYFIDGNDIFFIWYDEINQMRLGRWQYIPFNNVIYITDYRGIILTKQ